MLKTIRINKGVIVFYLIMALLTLLCVFRMNNLNIIGDNSISNVTESYYA